MSTESKTSHTLKVSEKRSYDAIYNLVLNDQSEKRVKCSHSNINIHNIQNSGKNKYVEAQTYDCPGAAAKISTPHAKASAHHCTCSQELLRFQMHPSLNKLFGPDEPLAHHFGYVIPKLAELDVLPLAQKFAHERDNHIVFYDPPHNPVHKYVLKGMLVGISCTGLVHSYCKHFDAPNIIRGMVKKPEFPSAAKYENYRSLPIYIWPSDSNHQENMATLENSDWKLYFASAQKYGDQFYKLPTPVSPFGIWENGKVVYWSLPEYKQHELLVQTLIQNMWDENSDKASGSGTNLHLCCEHWANEMFDSPVVLQNHSVEFGYAKTFFRDILEQYKAIPYRTEQIIYDEDFDFAGSVDLQLYFKDQEHISNEEPREIILMDHKRSKEIKSKSFGNEMMLPPLDELPDCNLYHYLMQLNIYCFILERSYHVRVVKMFLSIFHPNKENYLLIPIERRQDLVVQVFNERVQKLYGSK